MLKSKHIDKICLSVIAITLIITLLVLTLYKPGSSTAQQVLGYEDRLFDTGRVHQIDIVMDDWDSFIETCESEQYTACSLVIDGEKFSNIAIRGKGNTSLRNVKSLNSQRYSFKLEFDKYETGKSYYGLDKLCLNNLIQDNTMMKDYLVYQMMRDFGVNSSLCSFTYITVNGEDWGLYLAVEGVENAFQQRNYASEEGVLYKPESMNNEGVKKGGIKPTQENEDADNTGADNAEAPKDTTDNTGGENIESNDDKSTSDKGQKTDQPGDRMSFGNGSEDVCLKYIDDDVDSYSNIFESAKSDITKSDKKRLISSLKNLSEYTNLEETLDMEQVLRYFVVHNFVCNGDSYTGSMIHNYYLYENNGQLAMIPWDYNLAFGTFQGNNATSAVNESIDSPVSGGNADDRPMVGWIFSNEEYTSKYHELFQEFLNSWFASDKCQQLISDTADLIREYVEKDPTKFCTSEEFEKGVETLTEFVKLRSEAVSNQLKGDTRQVSAENITLSDMGTMANGGGGPHNMNRDKSNEQSQDNSQNSQTEDGQQSEQSGNSPEGDPGDQSGNPPEGGPQGGPEGGPSGNPPEGGPQGGPRGQQQGEPPAGFSQDSAGTQQSTDTNYALILLGTSIIVLLGGIVIAICKKQRI